MHYVRLRLSPRLSQGFFQGSQGELGVAIHPPGLPGRHVLRRIEAVDFSSDVHIISSRIEKVIGPIPHRPLTTFAHIVWVSKPTGEITPIPVIDNAFFSINGWKRKCVTKSIPFVCRLSHKYRATRSKLVIGVSGHIAGAQKLACRRAPPGEHRVDEDTVLEQGSSRSSRSSCHRRYESG